MPIVRAVLLAATLGAVASAAPAPTDYTPASISVQELLAALARRWAPSIPAPTVR